MDFGNLAALRQSRTGAASRRGLLAGLAGGALASGIFAHADDAAAKKRKKRKQNRKNKKKRQPTNAQTSIAATCDGSSFRINTTGDRRLAQPFVAQASGPLVRVALQLDQRETDGAGDYILRLSPVDDASVPMNQVLAESKVAGASVPDGPSTLILRIRFPSRPASRTRSSWRGQGASSSPGEGTLVTAAQGASSSAQARREVLLPSTPRLKAGSRRLSSPEERQGNGDFTSGGVETVAAG